MFICMILSMNQLEKTERAIKNVQSKHTGNTERKQTKNTENYNDEPGPIYYIGPPCLQKQIV